MKILSAVAGVILLWYAGASSAQPLLATGPEAEITDDGLHRVDHSIMDAAWVKPDLDLTRYTKIFFMPTGVQFRNVGNRAFAPRGRDSGTEFPVSDPRRAQLRELWGETFYQDLAEVESYEMYEGVGRDVLMVQGFLTDVISGVPPDTPGSSTGSILYPWAADIVLEIRDSMSNDILARAADRRRTEGPIDVAAVYAHTRATVRRWSLLMCMRLEELSDLSEP